MVGGGERCCINHKPDLHIASSLAEPTAWHIKPAVGNKKMFEPMHGLQKNVIFFANNSCTCVNLSVRWSLRI